MFELVAAAADIFFSGDQFDLIVGPDMIAGFPRRLPVDVDLTGHNGAFGFLAAFAEAAFDEGLINAGHRESGGEHAQRGMRAGWH